MNITMYQVDAFSRHLFQGNPAAVCPLDKWLPDELLQNIAMENNLSETAFIVPRPDISYDIRWFTPNGEVDLCGHATLAAAHIVVLFLERACGAIEFHCQRGTLIVNVLEPGRYRMDFPALPLSAHEGIDLIQAASNMKVTSVYSGLDYIALLASESELHALTVDSTLLKQLDKRGIVFTAPGEQHHFVARCFYPKFDVEEDPVTGSAYCMLAPYWATRLNTHTLTARQCSRRSGELVCQVKNDRVLLQGDAVLYMKGEIYC